MMAMVARLEAMLTLPERKLREQQFEQLRRLIRNGSKNGSLPPLPMSFPNLIVRDVRVDIEIIKGWATVPERRMSNNGQERIPR